jgi:hypothetical protein
MKKVLVTVSLLAGAVGLYAQGTVNWSDYVPGQFSVTIFGVDPSNPTAVEQYGNTGNGNDIPAGTAGSTAGGTAAGNYGGAPLAGSSYTVGLYLDTSAGNVTTDLLAGSPVATYSPFLGGSTAGEWTDAAVLDATAPGTPTAAGSILTPGTGVNVLLAAWNNNNGTIVSYANALAGGMAAGYSPTSLSQITLGGQPASGPPVTSPDLAGIGLTDFSLGGPISTTPEPSTIALGVIGASAFLMRLRRKQ